MYQRNADKFVVPGPTNNFLTEGTALELTVGKVWWKRFYVASVVAALGIAAAEWGFTRGHGRHTGPRAAGHQDYRLLRFCRFSVARIRSATAILSSGRAECRSSWIPMYPTTEPESEGDPRDTENEHINADPECKRERAPFFNVQHPTLCARGKLRVVLRLRPSSGQPEQ